MEREFDIITSKAIYEIKSGKARHKENQYLGQIKVAKELNKAHFVFSPNSSNHQIYVLRKKGINIFNNLNEFLEKGLTKL